MNKTAVDWLIDEYFGGIENCTSEVRYYVYKAKAIEKEQILTAFFFGGNIDIKGEQYYNETYEAQETN